MMRLMNLLPLAMLASLAGCGSSDSTGTTSPSGTSGSGPMSATIDGAAWSSATPAVTYQNNTVTIVGLDAGLTTSISMSFIALSAGTFSFALSNNSGAIAIVTKNKGSQGFSTASAAGGGSVTLSTLTAHHVVGTFAFTAVGNPASLGTTSVTNGKFDITF